MSSEKSDTATQFLDGAIQHHEIDDATFAVREFGHGPPLLFIHGYPLHGYTWRKLVAGLDKDYTCIVVDLPGLGDSDWTAKTDFSFTAQAKRLSGLMEKLDLQDCAVIAHDTGATIARMLTLQAQERISKLAIINTEIPHHRPPWIQFYQFCTKLPLHKPIFRFLLSQNWFIKTPMGLNQLYSNKEMLDEPANTEPYLKPLLNSPRRLEGMLGYLKGIDWDAVDSMAREHKNIQADVLFLWGEDDKTFPVELAEPMVKQFNGNCESHRIANASLLPHEEQPQMVLQSLRPFLLSVNA